MPQNPILIIKAPILHTLESKALHSGSILKLPALVPKKCEVQAIRNLEKDPSPGDTKILLYGKPKPQTLNPKHRLKS